MKPTKTITDAELTVLRWFWEHGAATARTVAQDLYPECTASDLATVHSLLQRLEAKKLVVRDRSQHVHTFSAAASQSEVAGRELQALADKLADSQDDPYVAPFVRQTVVDAYARAGVADARDLFIEHALVRREWDSPHTFLTHNDEVLEAAQAVGDRFRRADTFVADQALFTFYDDRVGPEVVSGRHFDRWWKDARAERPTLLTMTMDDFVRGGAGTAHDFPTVWRHASMDLHVTYRFDPGSALDGALALATRRAGGRP